MNGLTHKTKTLPARILSGSIVLLSASGLTTAINLVYNIVIAQSLGPKGFGHATVVYTLLTLVSAVTLSFQIISAKLVAQEESAEGKAAAYRLLHRGAWGCGILIALLLLFFQESIANYLNVPNSTLVALLAVGAAFYIPLGSRRGYVQGMYGFRRLATNLIVEGSVRLGGSFILILCGLGVLGVVAANSAAIAVAYVAIAPELARKGANTTRFRYALRELSQAMVFFSGQVLINNCDIVLVKHFFLAKEAGIYAAVAMVGRVILAFSSAVVNCMFPLVAGTPDAERRDLRVIATSLLLVLGTGSLLVLGLSITPAGIWTSLLGSGFQIAGKYNIPYLLALYAFMTILYSHSVVIISFEMSYKIANTSWVQLAFSCVVIAGICRFHASLQEVIVVQTFLMAALLVSVAAPFLVDSLTKRRYLLPVLTQPVRLLRRVAEDEVIAEFLRSDFHCSTFRAYRDSMGRLVSKPNLDDAEENAKRRALLFLRHLALWKEIPVGTEWYEVEINETHLQQIRVFPRAQWRRLARGNFSIVQIVENMRTRQQQIERVFMSKIASIASRLMRDDPGFRAVILIGEGESGPLTVLDGNHRLAAAMFASPNRLKKLRFICGLSPRMEECCWYNTNLMNLFRYGRNVVSQISRDPAIELARLLQSPG